LAQPGAVLAPIAGGRNYGVFSGGDRRRRPTARLEREQVRALEASGAIAAADAGGYQLTPAGHATVRRAEARVGEEFIAQHGPVTARPVVDQDGQIASARGYDPYPSLKRLSALRDQSGAPWLNARELAVAARLRSDWEAGQAGLVRGSDWSSGPKSSASRGPGNAAESAMIRCCEARARAVNALEALAAPLRRVVERVCLHDEGLETLERGEGWPSRSGKLALKLALAQLAGAS
jgi:hypothetical protein